MFQHDLLGCKLRRLGPAPLTNLNAHSHAALLLRLNGRETHSAFLLGLETKSH